MQVEDHLARMALSLEGLSVGDAFGERFFTHRDVVAELRLRGPEARGVLKLRDLGDPIGSVPWRWTDDTAMALSIVSVLEKHGTIDQVRLARSFAEQYSFDFRRGYGPAMHTLLPQLRNAKTWQKSTRQLFGGEGSFGNGAAMRVAPLGAFFADDMISVVEQARLSAEVTHAHKEGIAGAIAVAVGAAWAWRLRGSPPPPAHEFLDHVLPYVPGSMVANGVSIAKDLTIEGASLTKVVEKLGNGSKVTAQDTVPFVLWSAARNLGNYEEALWQTVSGLGDMDTNCAMVGGIVSLFTGLGGIPAEWLRNREPLPGWINEK